MHNAVIICVLIKYYALDGFRFLSAKHYHNNRCTLHNDPAGSTYVRDKYPISENNDFAAEQTANTYNDINLCKHYRVILCTGVVLWFYLMGIKKNEKKKLFQLHYVLCVIIIIIIVMSAGRILQYIRTL